MQKLLYRAITEIMPQQVNHHSLRQTHCCVMQSIPVHNKWKKRGVCEESLFFRLINVIFSYFLGDKYAFLSPGEEEEPFLNYCVIYSL